MTTTIRVSERTREILRGLAQEQGAPIQEVTEQAVEMYRRHLLLEATNAAYARLQAQQDAQRDFEQEIEEWDETLADGIEDEE